MTEPDFNFDDALKSLQAGKPLSGKGGVLPPLIKQLVEAALAAELESHIDGEEVANRQNNRKNGHSTKTIKSTSGSFELATPRDRTGTFEPQLIKKHQTHLTDEIERKILSLYALGSSYRDISGHIGELYGIDISSATINAVTDKIIPRLKEWQQRPTDKPLPVRLARIHKMMPSIIRLENPASIEERPSIRCWASGWMAPKRYLAFICRKMREPTSGFPF